MLQQLLSDKFLRAFSPSKPIHLLFVFELCCFIQQLRIINHFEQITLISNAFSVSLTKRSRPCSIDFHILLPLCGYSFPVFSFVWQVYHSIPVLRCQRFLGVFRWFEHKQPDGNAVRWGKVGFRLSSGQKAAVNAALPPFSGPAGLRRSCRRCCPAERASSPESHSRA